MRRASRPTPERFVPRLAIKEVVLIIIIIKICSELFVERNEYLRGSIRDSVVYCVRPRLQRHKHVVDNFNLYKSCPHTGYQPYTLLEYTIYITYTNNYTSDKWHPNRRNNADYWLLAAEVGKRVISDDILRSFRSVVAPGEGAYHGNGWRPSRGEQSARKAPEATLGKRRGPRPSDWGTKASERGARIDSGSRLTTTCAFV